MIRFTLEDWITLRPFIPADDAAVFATVRENLGHLQEYMDWAVPDYSLQSAQEFVERCVAAAEGERNINFGIFRGDKMIGTIGFLNFNENARRIEIGYWIASSEEGKGIITRSCQLLIDHAFNEMRMNRIEIRCAATNVRSAAVAERLGFTKEGILRQSESRHGSLHDFSIFGLLSHEWHRS
jgi:ribosomal-protein-serine acetyltransferase